MSKPIILVPLPTEKDVSYNRECLPAYLEAVRRAGGEPRELTSHTSDGEVTRALAEAGGILLPGSPADVSPSRYGQVRSPHTAAPDLWREEMDRTLLQGARQRGLPVLGVCYGLQSLNVWRGGTLIQDIALVPVNHAAGPSIATAHAVELRGASQVAEAARAADEGERVMVNSSHHQAIGIAGEGLRVTARSPEDGVAEAVEGEQADLGFPALAVQWHPERSVELSGTSKQIFAWLVRRAAAG